MLSGDIFEFNGDRFVARAKVVNGWLVSKMVTNKNGEERPTVGKPRLMKMEQAESANVVGKFNLNKPAPRAAPEPSADAEPMPDSKSTNLTEDDKTPEQLALEAEERRAAVERMIGKTGGSSSYDW